MKLLLLSFICFISACHTAKKTAYYFPAEWEPQKSIWLGWSTDSSIQQVHLEMAKALKGHVGLTVLSRSDSLQYEAMRLLSLAGIDTNKIKKHIHYIPNVFIRDAGPRFLKNSDNNYAIADFAWSNYGYPTSFSNYQYSDKRGDIDNDLAKELGLPVVSTKMVAEGGAIDVSSDMLLCFKETALQRNPNSTLLEIEKDYLHMYGKKKMIWLNRMPVSDKVFEGAKAGNYFGYGANGHTDEFVRFANDSTILIAMIPMHERADNPVNRLDFDILNENYQLLLKATNVTGRHFKIITLPVPAYSHYVEKQILQVQDLNDGDGKILFKDKKAGDEIYWLPAVSYLNFLISNKVILAAKYWQPGLPESERLKDENVREILQHNFPGYTVVQINPMGLNRNGGGMHCASQQQPK